MGNAVSNSVSDFVGGDDVAKDAWTMANRCLPLSDRLWAEASLRTRIATSMVGGAIVGKVANKLINGIVNLFKRIPFGSLSKILGKTPNCFVAGTLIHTKEGVKKIEEIKANDEVLSFNEKTKQTEYKPVVRTFRNQSREFLKVAVEGETEPITVTLEHPFYGINILDSASRFYSKILLSFITLEEHINFLKKNFGR